MKQLRVSLHAFVAICLLSVAAVAPPASETLQQDSPADGTEVIYEVRVVAPEHHWMEIEVTFPQVAPGPLELRMSRSSPGRYALHEFAKNVFRVRAFDAGGDPLPLERPDPYGWTVPEHDGRVTVVYRIFGDRADGTYLQVDTTHAHMNGPATFLWARGLEERPVRIRLQAPAGEEWTVATQLFPGDGPLERTAPNLRYLLDSPVEFGETRIDSFAVRDAGGEQTIHVALHHQGTEREAAEYVAGVRAIVEEMVEVFGEYPAFDDGSYTFIADYLPWASGDGMEHRNSTILTAGASLATAGRGLLGTVSHEFFHAWNVERIRPASLEPFDFEHANMSSELWLAEGFTSYYGDLVLHRAGIAPLEQFLGDLGGYVGAVETSPGVAFRSAVDMSRLAPFVDAARPVDPTYWSNTFLSYYTYGAALGLGLDLSLRDRTDGRVTLDDFMRAMWMRFGRAPGVVPPTVPRPYTVADARQVLAEVSGDEAFAREFFARHVEGTEVIDYAPLLERAGIRLQRAGGAPWLGVRVDGVGDGLTVTAPTWFGSPAYTAGIDVGDTLLSLEGSPLRQAADLTRALAQRSPGQSVRLRVRRRDGTEVEATATLANSPAIELVTVEEIGEPSTAQQRAFRAAWLGSQRRGTSVSR